MTAFVYKMADTSLPTSMVWIINAIRNFDRDLHTNICYCIFVYGIAVFCVLATGLTAPYGRYVNSSAVRGTLNFDARLGWFIQELPAFLVPSLIVYYGECPRFRNLPNSILLLFYLIHYTHRCFIYSLLMKSGKTMSLQVFGNAVIFCTVNGYLQSSYLLYHADFGRDWLTQPNFIIGSSMFLFGLIGNIHSDRILRSLRSPGEINKYKIPMGGLFEYVSGANFFAEIIEWSGFAVATWSLPAASFAFLTFSSLAPRAFHHHRYYREKFEDYPKNRKALIPFVI